MGQIRYWTFLVAFLLLCTGAVAAGEVPQVSVTSADEWVVAGSDNGTDMTAMVVGADGNPLPGMSVTFSCDTAIGTLSPGAATTGPDGTATVVFIPDTVSGVAEITATVAYDNEGMPAEVSGTYEQKIDHAAPYRLRSLDYESRVSVDTTTGIVFSLEDKYGNLVDAHSDAESFRFSVGSPDGTAGFFDGSGYSDDVVLPVGADGLVRAELKAARTAGENFVYVDLPDPVVDLYLAFYGIGDGAPSSITASVSPGGTPPYCYADGESRFTITYTMKDKYGNPAGNQNVTITSDVGTEAHATSNSEGQAQVTFGPRDVAGLVTITAVSVEDSTVSCTTVVEFVHTAPVDMLLTANPQTMPSYDVNPDPEGAAEVRAKVIDVKGNPVPGETVTFSLGAIDTGSYKVTDTPGLLETVATTDENGYATVHFRPGGFTTDRHDPDYSSAATGSGVVTAQWSEVTREIALKWVNFPYLSVSTRVEPESGQVAVNETIDVHLDLKGDGWALQPEPIDVVLAVDRSGSMMMDNPDRMVMTMAAAKTFVGEMAPSRDYVGLVSFGAKGLAKAEGYGNLGPGRDDSWRDDEAYVREHYPGAPGDGVGRHRYSDFATIDCGLTDDFEIVNSAVDTLIPYSGTPMRGGLYYAIEELVDKGGSDVRAVILLSDGDYNWYGDPLARGSEGKGGYVWSSSSWRYIWDPDYVLGPDKFNNLDRRYYRFNDLPDDQQNLAVFAREHNIKIYSIAFAEDITSGGRETLRQLAETSGGKYYYAPTGDDLEAVYTEIAGELKVEAGVDTSVDLSFENVEVNGASMPGDEVFEYVHADGISTVIESWIENETGRSVVVPRHTEDQTADWQDDQSLHFEVGTVKLGQTWTTSYRLKVKTEGNINVFGPGSTISFNDSADGGADHLDLPDTFISARPNSTDPVFGDVFLDVSNLGRVGTGPVTDLLTLEWDLDYNGTGTVTQEVKYSDDGQSWTPIKSLSPCTAAEVGAQTAILDVRDLPVGRYNFGVLAKCTEKKEDWVDLGDAGIAIGNGDATKIRLE